MKRMSLFFATLLLMIHGAAFAQSTYSQSTNLNHGAVNVTSAWTKLNTSAAPLVFNKKSATSKIEIYVNSRFSVGTIAGANGVLFQVKVDNVTPTFGNMGSVLKSNSGEFLAIYAVFPTLPAGSHTVSLWGQAAPSGTATNVIVDPGGWGGKIIIKETN